MAIHTPASTPSEIWPLVRVGDVAASFSGGTPPKSHLASWSGAVPWLSPKDMKATHIGDTLEHISEDAARQYSRLMPAGTVFVVVRGMILARDIPVAVSTTPMAFNQDMKAFTCSDVIDPEFLLYALISQRPALKREIGTSAHGTRRIGSSSLDDLLIPLPPLDEQRAIASALTTVRRRQVLEEGLLKSFLALKVAARAAAFGEVESEFQGRAAWPIVPLRDLLREPLRNGHSAVATSSGQGIPTLTLTAVTKGEFSVAHTKQTTADAVRVKDLWLRDGDVFIERANTAEMVGLAALFRGPDEFAIFPDLLIRVRVDEDRLAPEVLTEWLLTPTMRSYFQRRASGAATSMPKIDQGTVEDAPVPLPPRMKQVELRELFSTIDSITAAIKQRCSALSALFEVVVRDCIERQTIPADHISYI